MLSLAAAIKRHMHGQGHVHVHRRLPKLIIFCQRVGHAIGKGAEQNPLEAELGAVLQFRQAILQRGHRHHAKPQ